MTYAAAVPAIALFYALFLAETLVEWPRHVLPSARLHVHIEYRGPRADVALLRRSCAARVPSGVERGLHICWQLWRVNG